MGRAESDHLWNFVVFYEYKWFYIGRKKFFLNYQVYAEDYSIELLCDTHLQFFVAWLLAGPTANCSIADGNGIRQRRLPLPFNDPRAWGNHPLGAFVIQQYLEGHFPRLSIVLPSLP